MTKRGAAWAWTGAAALAILALPLAAAPKPAAKPAARPAARDWSRTVTMTPQGAFVLGNPHAKVRLVEYLSMTCSHCAAFTAESLKPLAEGYVRQGVVSVEVRHAIRDSLDVAASLLVRCGGAKTFFGNAEAVLASQNDWLRDAIAFQEADQGATAKLPLSQALAAFAHGAGLDRILAARGLTAAQANACLADKKDQDRLVAMAKEAWSTRAISGTPAFLINGTLTQGAGTWSALEPKLRDALAEPRQAL